MINNNSLELKSDSNNAQWYIFYTCPRAEKVVHDNLLKWEYEVFLPLTKTLRIWKNRQKKLIETPLFPGYIFVYTQLHELYNIKRLPKVSTFIHCGGKPSTISFKDIEGIKTMSNLNQEVTVPDMFIRNNPMEIIDLHIHYQGIEGSN